MDVLKANIHQSLAAGEYALLPDLLDQAELEDPAAFETTQWPHALHLLSHIYALRLEDARFLYKRMPAGVKKKDAAVKAGFALLQHLWGRQYEAVWAALAYAWPDQLQGMAAALRTRLQQRALDLVERAYADLAPARLAALMGVTEEEAAQAAQQRGWEVDPAAGNIVVKPRPPTAAAPASEEDLQRLAEYVVFLEA